MPDFSAHERNRLSWNAATVAHNSHKPHLAAFLRDGGSSLFPEEVELLGDVRGKSLVHLQCNNGEDTLSLTHLGVTVTGVDISDAAIESARALSEATGIPATFHRSDIYEWLAATDERFDMAFSSYGAVVWLSDVGAWARGIHRILRPGGRFVVVDFHPTFNIFNDDGWTVGYAGLGGASVTFEGGIGDYVADTGNTPSGLEGGVEDFANPHPVTEYAWGIGDLVSAFLDAGFTLRVLREYAYVNGFRRQPDMRALPGRRYTTPEGMPDIPMMYGLSVQK